MSNKRGRPKSEVKKLKTSFLYPVNFQNTLYIVKTKVPEFDGAGTSEIIVKLSEMVANGDLVLSQQYHDKQKIL